MAERNAALDAIIRDIEARAARHPDPIATLATLIKTVVESEADAYLLSATLVEGIAITVAQRIPAEKHGRASVEVVRLLRDRLIAHGTI